MKKSVLLLAAGLVALTSVAQERHVMNFNNMGAPSDRNFNASQLHQFNPFAREAKGPAHKTTTGGSRWYSYAEFQDTSEALTNLTTGVNWTGIYDLPIWRDTLGIIAYTSGPAHNTMVSIAQVFDPKFFGFNRADLYYSGTTPGTIKVTSSDAYTIDSVAVWGYYEYAKPGINDTLRMSYTKGAGGARASDNIFPGGGISGGHYGTVNFLDVTYDSVRNSMGGYSPLSYGTQDIILHSSSDTGDFLRNIALTTPISVPAGGFAAMSASFLSGDPAVSGSGVLTHLPGDTLLRAAAPYAKYNLFRPFIDYYTSSDPSTSTSITASWAPYASTNINAGYYKDLPNDANGWGSIYVPQWSWSTGGGASPSALQSPYFWWHVTCTTCLYIPMTGPDWVSVSGTGALINSVSAYPNPANEEVAIHFELSQANDVRLTVTNMMGQVVASQNVKNAANGNVVFNTATLPSGLYIYSLQTVGSFATGHVMIAH